LLWKLQWVESDNTPSKKEMPTTTEHATTFWVMAASHEESALHLHAKFGSPGFYSYVPLHSVLFLYYRSIELALKSYLLADGMAIIELRDAKRFGHKIDRLYSEAQSRGISTILTLTKEEEYVLLSMARYYSNKSYEYPEHVWVKNKPPVGLLRELCRKIVFSVEGVFDGPQKRQSHRLLDESLTRGATK
jgi:hypothetical protein